MKLGAVLVALTSILTAVLQIILLVAGSSENTFTNMNMFSLTSARLARADISATFTDACDCAEFADRTLSINITGSTSIRTEIRRSSLDLSEFFSVFTINYCEGSFIPDFEDSDASPALTDCKRPNLNRRFDIRTQVTNAIEDLSERINVTIASNLDWPGDISSAFQYSDSATPARLAFLVGGVMLLILAVIFGAIAIFTDRRIVNLLLVTFSILSLVSLGISAAIVTTIISSIVGSINSDGGQIGLEAEQGGQFIAATWAGIALLFLSTVVASLQFCTAARSVSRPAESTKSTKRDKEKKQIKDELRSEMIPMLGMQTPMVPATPPPPQYMPMQMPMRPQMPAYQYMPAMGPQYGMGYYGEPYAPQGWAMGGGVRW